MNFFEQQAKVRGRSRGLVLLFALAVLGIVAAVDMVVLTAYGYASHGRYGQGLPVQTVVAWTSLAVLGFIALCSLYRIAALSSGGGSSVAQELGATLVSPDTADARHRKLRNVVEEIAIASGVSVPQIFVLEQETGINAFASGFSPSDAAVTVTRGALDKLTRDELQGVIGHEFSHIVNGDMRLNIRLMGLLFGILALGVVAGKVLQAAPRGGGDRKGGGAIFVVALGVMVVGYIGVFFGRLIKAGVSRQREYLADASAVQFTRQSAGIAGALKKLAGVDEGSRLHDAHGEEVAHMLFGDGIGYSALFATHPPVLKRIKALEPQFDPRQIEAASGRWNAADYVPEDEERPLMADLAGGAAGAGRQAAALAAAPVTAAVGRPQSAHYDCAAQLRQALPAPLLAAAHGLDSAVELIYALLLDAVPAVREQQLGLLEKNFGIAVRQATAALGAQLAELPPAHRLPLAAICMPSLRRHPREELIRLMMTVSVLVHADGNSGVFEYCLARLLRMHIAEVLRPGRSAPVGRRKLYDCEADVQTLLSVVAEFGQDDAETARRAFLAGLQRVPLREALTYQPPADWAKALERALNSLDQMEPPAKEMLLEALSATIAADGKVTVEEAELLRTVCASLHCPLPPVLPDPAAAA
jgi:Zn-dependent protease with chaperone function